MPQKKQPAQRYRHRATRKSFLVIAEDNGICILQGIDWRAITVSRYSLTSSDSWEPLP